MNRRALLASAGLLGTAGCLADVRSAASGDVHHDHSRATVHSRQEPFVRAGRWPDTSRFRAWLFPQRPADDVHVFTDSRGAAEQREWENEVHNENYDEGFVLPAQARSSRDAVRQLEPAFPQDAAWTGWRRVELPFEFARREVSADVAADAEEVVSTFLGYYRADAAPSHATLAVYEGSSDAADGDPRGTVEAARWSTG